MQVADYFEDSELVRAVGQQLGPRLLYGRPSCGLTEEQLHAAKVSTRYICSLHAL